MSSLILSISVKDCFMKIVFLTTKATLERSDNFLQQDCNNKQEMLTGMITKVIH